ncbi:MAG: dehydrogenase [Tardiphaga sp.]|jgi:3-hydroxyisobutyrate dehydrogenase-like beta-hydroxyacid dehydrogenase|nr:dehydrogenase [Tardiphaga sp.]
MIVSSTLTIGWIGIGKMGLPMAVRAMQAGFDITGFDASSGRLALAKEQGLKSVASAAAAAQGKDAVVVSLPDDKVLRDAMFGSGGVVAQMADGAVLIETSTVSAEISAELAALAVSRNISYLRTPVSGNASIAHTGALTCFVSGPKPAFEKMRPLLASFTRAQTWLGEAEEARYAKLAVNLMIAVSAGMMAESLALARKGGIAWQDILNVLDDSAIASPMVKYKTAPLRSRDFESTFSCRQMAKDLDLILDAGREASVPLPLAALTRETYGALIAEGEGETDFIATVRRAERLSGLGEPGPDELKSGAIRGKT